MHRQQHQVTGVQGKRDVFLELLNGPYGGRILRFQPGDIQTIGRGEDNTIALHDEGQLLERDTTIWFDGSALQVCRNAPGKPPLGPFLKDEVFPLENTRWQIRGLAVSVDAEDGPIARLADYLSKECGRAECKLYAVVDTAAETGLYRFLAESGLAMESLLDGALRTRHLEQAPYLVALDPGSVAATRVLLRCWGKSRLLLLFSKETFAEVRKHLRRFLQVKTPEGSIVFFRFFDPRILRAVLPWCDAKQAGSIFAGIEGFLVETDSPSGFRQFQLIDQTAIQVEEYSLMGETDAAATE